MKQFKLLLTAAALMLTTGLQAQTDVTDTYITNADFSSSSAITTNLKGYGKDGTPYGLQGIDGWNFIVTSGDNDTASYPNSGMGGAVFAYGSSYQLQGNNTTAPSTNPSGESGNCLGFFGVWGCGGYYYQDVTLEAGQYTITVPMYSQSGNQANTSYTGFFTTTGTQYTVPVNPTVGQWVSQTVTFTLKEDTEGQIRLGYESTGSGSRANPMLYIDKIELTYTDPNAAANAALLEAAKYTLNGYIKKATALNGVLANTGLTTAIETAQGVYDNATDYSALSSVNDAATTLQNDIVTALTGAQSIALTNANFDAYNIAVDGTNSASFIEPATNDKPYIYPVEGWTQNFKFNSTASQGNTAAYGANITGNQGNNGTNPPATDMFGSSQGGTLHLSAGWGDYARYYQETTLKQGKYIMYYEAYNANTPTSAEGNYFGVSGEAGDFYGTTMSFVFDENKTFPSSEWKAIAFEFDVAAEKTVNVNVGICSTTGGSATGPKLWIDNVLVYRIGDVIVTEADANKILADVAKLDEAIYNAGLKSALSTAKNTFEANKTLDNYNALNEALIAAQESVTLYEELDAAIKNCESWCAGSEVTTVAYGLRQQYTNGTFNRDKTVNDIYSDYQEGQIQALSDADASDYTSVILNPSFETGDLTGWGANKSNDTGVKNCNDEASYSFSNRDRANIFNSWGGSNELYITQTIPELRAGTYKLSAVLAGFKGESLVLSANDDSKTLIVEGDKTVGYETFVIFKLTEAGAVTIKASNTKSQSTSDASFIKCDNFRLTTVNDEDLADADDYTALNAAIEAAEAKTLGFDAGEYAPYNNIDALTKLAEAKAIDQTANNEQVDVQALTNYLDDANNWAVN